MSSFLKGFYEGETFGVKYPVMDDDIESYWEVIRPPKKINDLHEVILSEGDASPTTAGELEGQPVTMVRVMQAVRSSDLPQSHPTVRPMIMNQDIYEDLLAWHSSTMNPHA